MTIKRFAKLCETIQNACLVLQDHANPSALLKTLTNNIVAIILAAETYFGTEAFLAQVVAARLSRLDAEGEPEATQRAERLRAALADAMDAKKETTDA